MAKKSMPKKQKKGNVKTPRPGPRRMGGPTLDAPALAYARLLADPCSAPLVHPIYTGSDAGYLIRADKVSTVAIGAGLTAGAIAWTPGLLDANNSDFVAIASSDWSTAAAANAYNYSPGTGFLQTNATAARCVAACLRITYPGSEANRAGWVQFGHSNGRAVVEGGSFAPSEVGVLCNHYTRTPADTVEIIWKPSFSDQEMVDPSVVKTQSAKNGTILVAWGGLPANVGMTVHLTTVFEWLPSLDANALSAPVNSKARSTSTLDSVMGYLVDRGFSWVNTPHGQNVVNGVATAAMSSIFGLMPSVARARGQRNLVF